MQLFNSAVRFLGSLVSSHTMETVENGLKVHEKVMSHSIDYANIILLLFGIIFLISLCLKSILSDILQTVAQFLKQRPT